MKNNLQFKLVFLIPLLFFSLSGCEKEEIDLTNFVEYDYSKYATPYGYISNWGLNSSETGLKYVVLLGQKNSYINETGWGPGDLDENCNVLALILVSPSLYELAPGKYDYDYGEDNNNAINQAVLQIKGEQVGGGPKISEMTMYINKTGDSYEFTYSGEFEDGEYFKGYFKGNVHVEVNSRLN